MGLGGALIMPTTLSILVNVFGDPRERAKAIAVWTAASGLGIALGPIAGGMLMRSFSWSSVFWINVPLLAAALLGTVHLVPDSRNPEPTKLDPVGALLSIAAIGSLVYAVITAPAHGWTSPSSLAGFAVGATIASLFVVWELHRDEPMLDMRLFANRSFSASSVALAMLFFAMAGTVFLQAQYLQFILGYTPLVAGVALVPAAFGMLFGTGAGAHMNAKLGGRVAVATGTLVAAAGVAAQAGFIDGSSYVPTGVGLLLFGLGAGIAMPAATDLIMATLPPARAGVGSAVNDTVRELGGALGVAVIGSIAATSYASSMQQRAHTLPPHQRTRPAAPDRQRRQRTPHKRPARDERNRDRVRRSDCVRPLDEHVALGRGRPCRLRDGHRGHPPPASRRAEPHGRNRWPCRPGRGPRRRGRQPRSVTDSVIAGTDGVANALRHPSRRDPASERSKTEMVRQPGGRTKAEAAVLDNGKPIILIVDPEVDASRTVEELVARYSRDYTIVSAPDVVAASQRMRTLAETADDVALILADRAIEGSRASRRGSHTASARTTRAVAELE